MFIGKAIKLARNNLDFTPEVLAERAEISVSYILRIEEGQYDPTLQSLEKIARSLGLTVRRLIVMAESIEDTEDELKQLGIELILAAQPILIKGFLK